MKFLKYTGLYLAILAIGDNVLKMAKADKAWAVLFYGGTTLWYMESIWEKDS